MFINSQNQLYLGDCAVGDRVATSQEVAAWELSRQPTPLQEIAELEASKPITHRMLRDLTMSVAQIASAVTGVDPFVNPAVQEIAALEAQIAAIRVRL